MRICRLPVCSNDQRRSGYMNTVSLFTLKKRLGKKVVRRPTIYHVVFFFVRVMFRSLLIAVFLHLAWG